MPREDVELGATFSRHRCSLHGRGGINFIVCDTFSVSNGLYFIYTQFFRHFFSTLSFISRRKKPSIGEPFRKLGAFFARYPTKRHSQRFFIEIFIA
jgi:hypothetical protein